MCAKATMEDFEALLKESFEIDTPEEGTVVKGKVIAIEAGQAIIDVGYKMEGRIDLKEFANPGEAPNINVGDEVEVYLDRVENARGEAQISARESSPRRSLGPPGKSLCGPKPASMARSSGASRVASRSIWAALWRSCPAAQVDVRPVRDAGPLMGMKQPFQILKMDRRRGNIVVSRRAILEESPCRTARRSHREPDRRSRPWTAWSRTSPNTVPSLIWAAWDGLLHVTDMAWRRVNHPSEILAIGEDCQSAGHQDQQGYSPHLLGHEAAAIRSVGCR